jgi:hypothetical protein
MPGQDDFIARLCSANQIGQLTFGFGDGNAHLRAGSNCLTFRADMDHSIVQIKRRPPIDQSIASLPAKTGLSVRGAPRDQRLADIP